MNKQKRPGLFLQIAGVLLCLCLISTHFTTGLYAKYTNRAQGSDAARAAKFNVSATVTEVAKETSSDDSSDDPSGTGSGIGEEGELPGDDLDDDTPAETTDAALTRKYTAVLTNSSEVAVAASIKMIFSTGVDVEGATVGSTALTLDPDVKETVVLNGPFYIAPGAAKTVEFTLTFSASSAFTLKDINNAMDPTAADANENLSSAEYQLPYNAIITFVQVD